jgi:hypothetical protein
LQTPAEAEQDEECFIFYQYWTLFCLANHSRIVENSIARKIVPKIVTRQSLFYNGVYEERGRGEYKRLLKLIQAFLDAGVMENGLVSPSVERTPQGCRLSPQRLGHGLFRRASNRARQGSECRTATLSFRYYF